MVPEGVLAGFLTVSAHFMHVACVKNRIIMALLLGIVCVCWCVCVCGGDGTKIYNRLCFSIIPY